MSEWLCGVWLPAAVKPQQNVKTVCWLRKVSSNFFILLRVVITVAWRENANKRYTFCLSNFSCFLAAVLRFSSPLWSQKKNYRGDIKSSGSLRPQDYIGDIKTSAHTAKLDVNIHFLFIYIHTSSSLSQHPHHLQALTLPERSASRVRICLLATQKNSEKFKKKKVTDRALWNLQRWVRLKIRRENLSSLG